MRRQFFSLFIKTSRDTTLIGMRTYCFGHVKDRCVLPKYETVVAFFAIHDECFVFFCTIGVEAEHAANVFYYLTYEGSVDLDSITDSVTKEVRILYGPVSEMLQTGP